VSEVIMSHLNEPGAANDSETSESRWTSSAAARDWDTETDVMPPEYCRQLLEISRQLEQRK
jgi:hypothetical protein